MSTEHLGGLRGRGGWGETEGATAVRPAASMQPLVPLDGPLPQDRPTFLEDLLKLNAGQEISAARIRFVASGGPRIRFHVDDLIFEGIAPFADMSRKLRPRVAEGLYVTVRVVDPCDRAHALPILEICSIDD